MNVTHQTGATLTLHPHATSTHPDDTCESCHARPTHQTTIRTYRDAADIIALCDQCAHDTAHTARLDDHGHPKADYLTLAH